MPSAIETESGEMKRLLSGLPALSVLRSARPNVLSDWTIETSSLESGRGGSFEEIVLEQPAAVIAARRVVRYLFFIAIHLVVDLLYDTVAGRRNRPEAITIARPFRNTLS
jgi:hypothetical protein